MSDTMTQGLNSSDTLSTVIDSYYTNHYISSMWSAGSLMYSHGKRTKSRNYQCVGHKEKVLASRRRKNKAAKKARKKNR